MPSELREHAEEVKGLEREEEIRLTYVAATRAKDLLVVPAVADKKIEDTWTQVLYPSLYPVSDAAENAAKAPGCPDFGWDTVLEREQGRPGHVPIPGLPEPRCQRQIAREGETQNHGAPGWSRPGCH